MRNLIDKLRPGRTFLMLCFLLVFSCSKDKEEGNGDATKLTLTITKPINGTLVSDPAGINCGSKGNACKAEFSKGMEVTLIAKADKGSVDTDLGYAPAAWQGNCDKTEADQACKLSMDANKAAGLLFTDADVDDDNDGLIEIHNLDMFNHIQYSLAGTSYKTGADAADDQDGAPTATTANCKTATDGVYLCGYELVGDLDFAEGASYAAGSVNTDWRPLDVDDSPVIDDPPDMATNAGFVGATDFAGIFEGNGYKITHLYSRGGGNRGLFRSTTSTASIRNLGVVDANLYGGITNDGRVGGLAGDNAGSIVSCYAKGGTVNGGNGGQDYTGGLVGLNIGSILASFSTSTVNGSGNAGFNRVGGLVGYSKSSSTITASFATGNVSGGSGNGDLVGGLAGQLSDGCIILASYATGTANGNVSDNVGGLVGHMSVGTNTITHSYSFGSGTKEGSGNDGTAHPTGLTGAGAAKANTLTDPAGMDDTDADDVWDDAGEKTKGAWDFGTNSQRPALKYADYDGIGGTDYCAMFPTKIPGTDTDLACGTTLLPGQGR